MNNNSIAETPSWQEVLPVLRQLSAELDGGIRALAHEDLDQFEKHVAAQGKICDLLLQTNLFAPSNATPKRAAIVISTRKTPAAVHEIAAHIDHQTRVFQSLLTRGKRFVEIMLAFQQSYRGYSAKGPLPLEGNTWSSEV
jgi:hypothetical protein